MHKMYESYKLYSSGVGVKEGFWMVRCKHHQGLFFQAHACVCLYIHNVCKYMSGQRVNGLGIMIRGSARKDGCGDGGRVLLFIISSRSCLTPLNGTISNIWIF